ncbi:MAG: SDR family oxidoreductase [bacterium]|nr:SDR family oxidoreductase [bacterium]
MMDFRGRSVLVTGGAGFIGSHLVDAFVERGAAVRVLDDLSTGRIENLASVRPAIEFIEAGLADREVCARACAGCRVIFHQAALGSVPRSMRDPASTIDVNVGGTANLLAAARDAEVERVVYASSSSVYGASPELPRREGREGPALSPYALSKQMGEQLAEIFGRCFGMELIGLRYFNVYGPRQRPDGPYAAVVPRFIQACRAGERPTIYGDGRQSRDFTYVEDVVEANLLAATAPAGACGKAYNVGCGTATTITRLARLIAAIFGRELEPVFEPPRDGDVHDSVADPQAATAAIGFQPRFDLDRGLARTCRGDLTGR